MSYDCFFSVFLTAMFDRRDRSISKGSLGFSIAHRRWGSFSLNQDVRCEPYDPLQETLDCYIGEIIVQVDFHSKNHNSQEVYDVAEMASLFTKVR